MKKLVNGLFPNKKKDKATIEAELKTLSKNLEEKIREMEKKSEAGRAKAKAYLKAGNEPMARKFLAISKQHQNQALRFHGMQSKIDRHLQALSQAQLASQVTNVMGKSAQALKAASNQVNPETVMQIDEQAETAMDQIDESMEILGSDLETDAGIDIENELAALDSENMLEDVGKLPESGTATPDIPATESEKKTKEELQNEIAKMKKELSL